MVSEHGAHTRTKTRALTHTKHTLCQYPGMSEEIVNMASNQPTPSPAVSHPTPTQATAPHTTDTKPLIHAHSTTQDTSADAGASSVCFCEQCTIVASWC